MEVDLLTLTNDSAQVENVQRKLEAILQASGVRPKIVMAFNVALGECLENIIQHAYDDGATHPISVQCIVAPAEIVLRVTDDGRPFDPCTHPVMATTPNPGQQILRGRGIHLIRHLVDRLSYERADGKNILTMAKACRLPETF